MACRDVKTFQMLFSVSQLFPPSSVSSYCMESANPTKLHFCTSHFSHKGLQKEGRLRGHFSSGNVFPFVKKKGVRGDKTFANSLRFVGPKLLGGMIDHITSFIIESVSKKTDYFKKKFRCENDRKGHLAPNNRVIF